MNSDSFDLLALIFWLTTLKIFNAADFGIVPNEDISEKLAEFISVLKAEDGEKTAVFDSGTYYIDSKRCKEYMLVITNTAGEKEFSPDETPLSTPFHSISAACRILFLTAEIRFLLSTAR